MDGDSRKDDGKGGWKDTGGEFFRDSIPWRGCQGGDSSQGGRKSHDQGDSYKERDTEQDIVNNCNPNTQSRVNTPSETLHTRQHSWPRGASKPPN